MTDDSITSHDRWDDAAAAYGLDVLDPSEVAAFVAHLQTCDRCRQAVAETRRVAAALGVSTETSHVELPASLRARTLARATGEPPQMAGKPSAARMSAPRAFPWRWVAAAAFVVAAGLGWYALTLDSELADVRRRATDAEMRANALAGDLGGLRADLARLNGVAALLGAPDLVRVDLKGQAGAPGATGRAFVSKSAGVVFRADRLPALPAGRVYQLWVIPPGPGAAPVSAGVLARDASNAYSLSAALPSAVPAVKTVAVTDEAGPAGSPGPTTPILLVGTLGE